MPPIAPKKTSQAGATATDTKAGDTTKTGRNDPCPCGSGLKFKHCCQAKQGHNAHIAAPGRTGAGPARAVASHAISTHLRTVKRLGEAGRWAEAIASLREIARLDPNSAEAHHDLGITLLRCGYSADAAVSLQRAVELRPGFAGALAALARALDQEGREPDASSAYRRASRAADDPAERHVHQARALMLEDRFEEADGELRRALALAPGRAGPCYLLGQLLSQRGLFEAALEHFTRAIELAPDEPYAFQDLAIAKRMTDGDRPLLARMQAIAERPGVDETLRISLRFGLGKAFDDLGDRAAAMQHYDTANLLKARSVHLDRASLMQHFDSLIAGFTVDTFEAAARAVARPPQPGDDLPVLILGMPRSGTTLVEQVLSSHPAVGAGGELSFWRDRLDRWRMSGQRNIDAATIAQTADAYRTLLRGTASQALRITDKAPVNFQHIWLIRLAFPDARIVHCRRNPVDTCLSIFFQHFKGRHDYAYDRSDLVFYYRQYQRLMDHWRRVLPPDRFIEVEYERLIADRETESRRLVAFCGLGWDDACLAPERNERVVKTASRWQARQPIYATSVERWRRYEPWLGALRELLDDAAVAGAERHPA
jgi:Flp pilus assembly protein TadD